MRELILLNGPGGGKVVKISDETLASGRYFYFGEPEQITVVNLGTRSFEPVTPTYMYRIKRRVSNGEIQHVGVCQE